MAGSRSRARPDPGARRSTRGQVEPVARAILAGSTLGLAGVGAALVLALGGSAAPPAFAITKQSDGSVLVKLNYLQDQNLPQVNDKLTALGTHEQITIYMATGAAAVNGPVTCTPGPGAGRRGRR